MPQARWRAGIYDAGDVCRRFGCPPQADPIRSQSHWIIDRTKAWWQNFRRLLVRHKRLLTTYRAFVVLSCVMITLATLLR